MSPPSRHHPLETDPPDHDRTVEPATGEEALHAFTQGALNGTHRTNAEPGHRNTHLGDRNIFEPSPSGDDEAVSPRTNTIIVDQFLASVFGHENTEFREGTQNLYLENYNTPLAVEDSTSLAPPMLLSSFPNDFPPQATQPVDSGFPILPFGASDARNAHTVSEHMIESVYDEYSYKAGRDHLQNKVAELSQKLDEWLRTRIDPFSYGPPNPNPTDTSEHGGTACNPIPQRPYDPDYSVPEILVTNHTIILIQGLLHDLSLLQHLSLLDCSRRLEEIRERCQDIGISNTLLADLALAHLKVLGRVESYCSEDWLRKELWECALDYLMLLGQLKTVTTKGLDIASAALCKSIGGSQIVEGNSAPSPHYGDLICEGRLVEYLRSLRHTLALNPSVRCAQRLLWTINMHCRQVTDIGPVEAALHQVIPYVATVPPDPSLAALYLEIASTLEDSDGKVSESRLDLSQRLHTVTDVSLKVLQLLKCSRPSRFHLALAGGLEATAKRDAREGKHATAIDKLTQAAVQIARPALQGEVTALRYLFRLGATRIHVFLSPGWRDWRAALSEMKPFATFLTDFSHILDPTKTLCSCLKAFDDFCAYSRTSDVVPLVHGLMGIFRPRPSPYLPPVMQGLLTLMSTGVETFRYLGEFSAALNMSRDMISVVKEMHGFLILHPATRVIYAKALICHARCLLDHGLPEAPDMLLLAKDLCDMCREDPWYRNAYAILVGRFAVFYTLDATMNVPEVIDWSLQDVDYRPMAHSVKYFPSWFGCVLSYQAPLVEERVWLLLLKSTRWAASETRDSATMFARDALALISTENLENRHDRTLPHIRASMLGHKYLLQLLLGNHDEARATLDMTAYLYRTVLKTNPHMARLPLLILVEVLISLSHELEGFFGVLPFLQAFKSKICRGSSEFFDPLMVCMRELQRCIPPIATDSHNVSLRLQARR